MQNEDRKSPNDIPFSIWNTKTEVNQEEVIARASEVFGQGPDKNHSNTGNKYSNRKEENH